MPVRRAAAIAAVLGALATAASGCGDLPSPGASAGASPSASGTPAGPSGGTATASGKPSARESRSQATKAAHSSDQKRALGTYPPTWLGTRALPETADGFGEQRPTPPELRNRRFTLPDSVPMLPGTGFASDVVSPPPAEVISRSTWQPSCPVGVEDLAWVRLTFRGFDGARHTGELLLNKAVAADIVTVFHALWDQQFPIEEMRVTRRDELDAPPTGDGNNTSAFVCRPIVGSTSYSQHAYGLAVDVNEFQNPYTKGDLLLPELASAYLDRSWRRPGMLTDAAIAAFARVGWEWGGDWRSLKDRHHFSLHNL